MFQRFKFNFFHYFLLNLFLVVIAQPVIADTRANTLRFTIGGGYDFFSSQRHIQNALIPYLGLGYDITPQYGFEGLLGFFTTHSKITDQTAKLINGTLFLFDALYHFPSYHHIEPYLLFGAGITSFNPNGNDAHTTANVNAGLGIEFFQHEIASIRLDVRDIYTIANAKNDLLVSASLSFFLDLC